MKKNEDTGNTCMKKLDDKGNSCRARPRGQLLGRCVTMVSRAVSTKEAAIRDDKEAGIHCVRLWGTKDSRKGDDAKSFRLCVGTPLLPSPQPLPQGYVYIPHT